MEFLPDSTRYTVDAVLGQGTQATVFRATYTDSKG